MKLVKMSLVAAMLMGASAFAIENTKITGHAQLFYHTADAGEDAELFDKANSAADAAIHLGVTTDLTSGISAGATFTAVSTLGLENNFVGGVWSGAHGVETDTGATYGDVTLADGTELGGVKVENASWFEDAWLAGTYGGTTAKIGRMQLDTPLAFTETWSVSYNTFEAAVLINSDLPDTTLVGAYVGNGNGTETFGQDATSTPRKLGLTAGGVVNENGNFATYGTDGAYAIGAINNSLEMLTVQAWYYDVSRLAQAYWLQADATVMGVLLGAQYSGLALDTKTGAEDVDSSVYAVMAGYELKDIATLKIAYSGVDTDYAAGFNTATGTGASKLYTEAWWSYGYVTGADTTAITVTAEGSVGDIVDLGAYFTMTDQSEEAGNADLTELTLTASKSFGPLDTSLAYINTDVEGDDDAVNTVQAFLTYNF